MLDPPVLTLQANKNLQQGLCRRPPLGVQLVEHSGYGPMAIAIFLLYHKPPLYAKQFSAPLLLQLGSEAERRLTQLVRNQ